MKKVTSLLALSIAVLSFTACGSEDDTETTENSSAGASVDGSRYLLEEEPDGVTDVITARKDASDGEEVVIVGRIGGSTNPWIEGRSAFSIVDESLKACSDIPGDNCAKPWDYCCETDKLPDATVLVKVVDEDEKIVKTDARQLLGVQELSTVVIQGQAQRDDAGNLVVMASGIYIRSE